MRRRLIALFTTLVVVAGGITAWAQQLDYDEIAKRPGFTVTKKTVDGQEVVTIRKATVTIHINKDGAMGMDQNTAVLCAWTIYVDVHVAADYCFPDSERELKEDLADGIERFKDFIVANSLRPVTRSDLDAYVEKQRADLLSRAPKVAAGAQRCPRTDQFSYYQVQGREKRRAEITQMLAVPRPPVMNPCL